MSDNLYLSDIDTANPRSNADQQIADVCSSLPKLEDTDASENSLRSKSDALSNGKTTQDLVAFYLSKSRAENTKRAYLSDLEDFASWGGRIPATAERIAAYLADRAGDLAVSTLRRRLAALAWAHRGGRFADPTKHQIVIDIMRGIERHHGVRQRQARPLLHQNLLEICSTLGSTPKDKRDRTLLTLGFFSAMRGTELVSTLIDDLDFQADCVEILIRKSKTDQTKRGRTIVLPRTGADACPVVALNRWLAELDVTRGYLFPAYGRRMGDEGHLSLRQLTRTIRMRVSEVGISPRGFSSHSLRAGFVTSGINAGIASTRIRAVTGHASEQGLGHYFRPADCVSTHHSVSFAIASWADSTKK